MAGNADTTTDVTVIGAGIVGVSTALHLLMKGRKVLLIDQGEPGQGTSYGNAGIMGNGYLLPFGFPKWRDAIKVGLGLSTSARIQLRSLPYYTPWLIEFHRQSRPDLRQAHGHALWELQKDSTDDHRFLMQGTDAERHLSLGSRVSLYRSAAALKAESAFYDLARGKNVPFEIMDAATFREQEPYLKLAFAKAVRWTTSAQLRNPGAVVEAYAERFIRQGGTILRTRINKLEPTQSGTWLIASDTVAVTAKDAVVCAGPQSGEILKPLGYNFPMISKRGYHQHFTLAPGATLNHALVDTQYGYVLSPMEQGIRLTTGVEFALPGTPPTPVQISQTLPRAQELLPLGPAVEPKAWLGNRPCFADSLPIIDAAPRHKNLWLNFGHGHLGMTIGPASGKILAQLMITGDRSHMSPYRADRFS